MGKSILTETMLHPYKTPHFSFSSCTHTDLISLYVPYYYCHILHVIHFVILPQHFHSLLFFSSSTFFDLHLNSFSFISFSMLLCHFSCTFRTKFYRFSMNRIFGFGDQVLPSLQHGFLRSDENVVNVVNFKMVLWVLVVMDFKLLKRTMFCNGRWNCQHMGMADVLAMCNSWCCFGFTMYVTVVMSLCAKMLCGYFII